MSTKTTIISANKPKRFTGKFKGRPGKIVQKTTTIIKKPKRAKSGYRKSKGRRVSASGSPLRRILNSMSPSSKSFVSALTNPFATSSRACRVPDGYHFPTSTLTLAGEFVVGASTAGVAGAFSLMMLPNPFISVLDVNGANITNNGMYAMPASSSIYGATQASNFVLSYASYRVVSWGIQVQSMLPELTGIGRIGICHMPCTEDPPPYGLVNQIGATNLVTVQSAFIGTTSLITPSNIYNLPYSEVFNMQTLFRGDVQVCGLHNNSAVFYDFKSLDNDNFNGSGQNVGLPYWTSQYGFTDDLSLLNSTPYSGLWFT